MVPAVTNNLPTIDLDNFKDGIKDKITFVSKLEEEIFNYESIKDESLALKIEYYKLAKTTLMNDLNFIKTLPLGSDDEMLKNIITSLNKEQKQKLRGMIVKLISEDQDVNKT